MLASRTRGALIVGALLIFALALPAAAWALESSQITSPANNTFLFVNEKGTIVVKGTSTSVESRHPLLHHQRKIRLPHARRRTSK